MAQEMTLRIGLLQGEATRRYYGRLRKHKISVRPMYAARPVEWLFGFREVYIPDNRRERNVLREYRCHLLLRVRRNERYCIEILRNDLVSNGPDRGWKLYIGGVSSYWGLEYDMQKRERATLLTATEVAAWVRRLFEFIPPKQMEQWLARMTPPSWEMPPVLFR